MVVFKKCFITVGTTKFDLLCETILKPSVIRALMKLGCEEISFQIGQSAIEPGVFVKEGLKFHLFRMKDSLKDDINSADLIITHAGAGSCLEALYSKKPILAVVNEDLMNNHQNELATHLHSERYLYSCTCGTLENTLLVADFNDLVAFSKPNLTMFAKYVDDLFAIRRNEL